MCIDGGVFWQRASIEAERMGPLAVREKALQFSKEATLLKKRNQQLVNTSRKLEQKVHKLEKVSK